MFVKLAVCESELLKDDSLQSMLTVWQWQEISNLSMKLTLDNSENFHLL